MFRKFHSSQNLNNVLDIGGFLNVKLSKSLTKRKQFLSVVVGLKFHRAIFITISCE